MKVAFVSAEEKRRKPRNVLCYYLKVICLETGKELGRIGDITDEGMMLLGNTVLDKNKTYNVRVILTKSVFDISLGNLDIKNVTVRWSRPDSNPQLILTGMLFSELDEKARKIVRNLVERIGMKRRLDLTDEELARVS